MRKSLPAGTEKRWAGFLFVGGVLASIGAGCGMFDIRDPIPPVGPACRPDFATPSRAESVLFNFAQSFGCQVDGLEQYEGALAETFHLVLDVVDVQEIGIPGLDSLSKAQDAEAQRLRSQDASADSFYFAFANVKPTERTDQTAYYLDIPYELRIGVRQGDSLAVTQMISGTSDLYLAEIQTGKWAITRWVDQRQDPFMSLGRWHAERVGSSQAPRIP